ncbi:MAG: helix-turn-helix transcriptional regulator [Oscillospiraceae bacterium]
MNIEEIELFTNENICSPNFMEYLKVAKTNKERVETVGATLQNIRTKAGFTQKQISTLLGISVQAYSGYENGKHEPTIETLVKLSYLYEVSVDYLCGKHKDRVDNMPIAIETINDMEHLPERIEEIQIELYEIKEQYKRFQEYAKKQNL